MRNQDILFQTVKSMNILLYNKITHFQQFKFLTLHTITSGSLVSDIYLN